MNAPAGALLFTVALVLVGLFVSPAFAVGAGVAAAPLIYLYYRSLSAERVQRAIAGDLAGRTADLQSRMKAGEVEGARLGGAIAAMPEPVLIADGSGRIVAANTALEALAGVKARGRLLEEVFPATEMPRLRSAADSGEPVLDQITLRGAQGPRTWQVQASAAGPGDVVMSLRDVTEPARALQVRTDFVANASHELRTPITAIRMALETLGALGDQEAPTRLRLMEVLVTQVARLEELVRDLLDLSRLESEAEVRPEPVLLDDVAATLRSRFDAVCRERRLSLELHAAPGLAVSTDRRLLELILGNLIENATKFAFAGTAVRIDAAAGGGVARIEVTDRGVGIPLEQQGRIFERFYQVDPSRSGGSARRGSGLGLAIVKHAVRRLGGTIRVRSVWQQGTTMTVELPGLVPPSGAAAPVSAE